MAVSTGRHVFYVPFGHTNVSGQLTVKDVLSAMAPAFNHTGIKKYFYDLKTALVCLDTLAVCSGDDLQLAAYLLNPAKSSYELDDIAWEYLHEKIPSLNEIAGGKGKMYPLSLAPLDKMAAAAGQRAEAILDLAGVLAGQLEEIDVMDLYRKVEMPLLHVLAEMEKKGVLLDLALLKQMSAELTQLLALSESKIHHLAGEKFNINSPKQLQHILFEKLKLPAGKKTKEGYSTDVDVLTELARSHELPAEVLAYRSLAKLKSTYVDALPALVNPQTGRIHTSYNQTVTATGRLSSSNPNLQNIPIRTLEGKRIRQAFIADPDCFLISPIIRRSNYGCSRICLKMTRSSMPLPPMKIFTADGLRCLWCFSQMVTRTCAAGQSDQLRHSLWNERFRSGKRTGRVQENRPGIH
jgi:DNA polymerase-1